MGKIICYFMEQVQYVEEYFVEVGLTKEDSD